MTLGIEQARFDGFLEYAAAIATHEVTPGPNAVSNSLSIWRSAFSALAQPETAAPSATAKSRRGRPTPDLH